MPTAISAVVDTVAVAAAFGAEPWPASLENKPRRMPWANATPSPAPATCSATTTRQLSVVVACT